MALSGEQKNFIKKYIWEYSPAEIAAHLEISEQEIHDYLKKRWRPEKYAKYLARFTRDPKLKNFTFRQFFKDNKLVLSLLSLIVLISYANSLGNGFVSDDIPAIQKEPNIGHFASYVFSTPFGVIQRILYSLTFKTVGLNPGWFRFPNILFHLGATLAVFFVLYLIAPRVLATMGAFLFAVHPMLAESITWISGNLYTQQGFFFLVSLGLYILAKQKPKLYYYSVGAFALAVSSSEKAIVLSVVFLFYELAFGNLKENWKKTLPFLGISLVAGLYFLGRLGTRVTALQQDYYLAPGTDSLLVKIPTSVWSYLRLILWPDQLTLYHTEMVFSTLQYRGTILVFLLYTATVIYFYKKNKFISFWLLFFLIPLAPTLTPMRIAWAVAERYAYLSVLGIVVVVAWIFYKISQYEKLKNLTYVVFAMVVIALSVRTIVRNRDWKNEETLWFATVKVSPSGPNIHNNLGTIYQEKGQNDKAISEFQLAITINPQYADAYHNLGNVYYQMKDYPQAVQSYQTAAQLNPRLWQSHQNLAAIYYNEGLYDFAQQEIQKALEINPNEPSLQQNMQLIEGMKQNTMQPQQQQNNIIQGQ